MELYWSAIRFYSILKHSMLSYTIYALTYDENDEDKDMFYKKMYKSLIIYAVIISA